MKIGVASINGGMAVIRVRWCLTEMGAILLKEINIRKLDVGDPFVLITDIWRDTYNEVKEMRRFIFPLSQLIGHIEFTRPGQHVLGATIVLGESLEKVRERFLEKSGWKFEYSLLNEQGEFLPHGSSDTYGRSIYMLHIEPDFFAADPPRWEQAWVNRWFSGKPRNQCDYRRRRLIAYSVQPVFIAIWWFFYATFATIIVAVRMFRGIFFILDGIRKIKWKALLHPFQDEQGLLPSETDYYDSFFLRDKFGNRRVGWLPLLRPNLWIMLIVWATLWNAVMKIFFPGLVIPWSRIFVGILSVIGTTGIVMLGVTAAACTLKFIEVAVKNFSKLWEAKNEKKIAIKQAQRLVERNAHITAMVSEGEPYASLDALPRDRRTFHLRFQDFKAKVCKPFAH